MKGTGSIFTLANFNLQNFNAALKKAYKDAEVKSVEYGQMLPYLLNIDTATQKEQHCICWITQNDVEQATSMRVDLSELVFKLGACFQQVVVILPVCGGSDLNFSQGTLLRNELYRFNFVMAQKSVNTNVHLLDPTSWLVQQGANAISYKLWYLSKTPFHTQVFRQAAIDCSLLLNALLGISKKVLIVDLDDTLWGGIVGDDGLENLKIGGHDALGEAFADFQLYIQQLKLQGIILGICSKNEEKTAWEVFEKHTGMVLRKDDFVTWRINWNDKASNIADMVRELNVGMDSVVFLDDNKVERDRVRNALAGIYVPELPDDKMEYPAFIRSLHCFNIAGLTDEDKRRTELYKNEKNRVESQYAFSTVDEWIHSLQIELRFEELNSANLMRAHQLLNKTNQMNLRTRRLGKEELLDWANKEGNWLYVVHVTDVFDDNGITGLLGFHITPQGNLFIDDFVMSCRIMGRKIEYQMMEFLIEKLNTIQGKQVMAEYLETEKNKPVKDFFVKASELYPFLSFKL
jgi:FkbH-like protein